MQRRRSVGDIAFAGWPSRSLRLLTPSIPRSSLWVAEFPSVGRRCSIYCETDLNQVEWRPTGAGVSVVAAQLGELAGAIGAARFAALQRS